MVLRGILFLIFSFFLLNSGNAQVKKVVQRASVGKDRLKAFQQQQKLIASSTYKYLKWRNVGPGNISGRCIDVAGIPGNKRLMYAAFATGGFWRTTDSGKTWTALFDKQGTQSVGCFAIADSDSSIIYLGTGEANIFRASLPGIGVFKSTDGGKSWKHIELENTGTISRIVIHPKNPNTVYVASSGNEWSYNHERGVYKTIDGGKSWNKILGNDNKSGCIDLVMDPSDTNTLVASMWNRIRKRWSDPIPEDGDYLFKTTDGGRTWKPITNGLPETKYTGRIGVAFATSSPGMLYAFVDNHTPKREPKSGETDPYGRPIQIIPYGVQVYRSANKGETFNKVSMDDDKLERFCGTYGWVFGQIKVDPNDEAVVYIMGVPLAKSIDSGRTFSNMEAVDKKSDFTHGDHHALWIDPTDPEYIINANDGGVVVSYNGGKKWKNFFKEIPTTQFYNITYDMKSPYNVFGSVQDAGTLMGSIENVFGQSDTTITNWQFAPGGEGTMIALDPQNPDIEYSCSYYGRLMRSDLSKKDSTRSQNIYPEKADDEETHRGEWLACTILSPHDNKIVYHGFQYVFKSADQGKGWKRISPDLSYNNKDKVGKTPYSINHQAITALDESPLKQGLLYVGTDDGRVWVTMNEGEEWKEIVRGLPINSHTSRLVASNYDENTVYLTLSDRREDNIKPYIFKSGDYGKNWKSIAGNLPAAPVNVIREDPKSRNILYCGTDMGVYVSKDGGKSWQSLQANLPASVSVQDLFVHPRDNNLVIATYGRGVWVIDNISSIQQ